MSQKHKSYVCAVCGAKVERVEHTFTRACEHADAAVQVNLSATVEGKSKVAGG